MAEIGDKIEGLENAGYSVLATPFMGPDDLKSLRNNPPSVIIIDLSRLPSQGRDIALSLRQYKSTRQVPIIFIEGNPEKTEKIKSLLPDATYSNWKNILTDLKAVIENPPQNHIVIKSAMDGYAGAPLDKKLGIKKGMVISLIDAPDGFKEKFANIAGVKFVSEYNVKPDLIIWFVKTLKELELKIEKILPHITHGGIWIAWQKKSSGISSDITQNEVRQTGLALGIVDYKVCSIDETWSALKFSKRKQK